MRYRPGYIIILTLLLTACTNTLPDVTVSKPLPWSNQLALAQEAADRISVHAQLVNVEGLLSSDASGLEASGPVKMSYIFQDTKGDDIEVAFVDTAASSTLRAEKTGEHDPPLSDLERQHLQDNIALITVSAADALEIVQQHREEIMGNASHDLFVGPGAFLYFDDQIPSDLGLNVAWHVALTTKTRQFEVWIDPHTGMIVKQTSRAFP